MDDDDTDDIGKGERCCVLPPRCPEINSFLLGKGDNFAVYATTSGPSGYEVYVTVPGIADPKDDLRVEASPHGTLDITARLSDDGKPSGDSTIANLVIELPAKLDAESTMALFVPNGQLYVRVLKSDQTISRCRQGG
jgi:HSP20 family molecular chaperone IbpA